VVYCSLDKFKITRNCDDMNTIEDNIDDISSFSLILTRGVNSDDWNDNVEDNELYIWGDHFEGILVKKSRKKLKKIKVYVYLFFHTRYLSV